VKKNPVIAVTMGDPLGIGPEIIVKALRTRGVRADTNFRVYGAHQAFSPSNLEQLLGLTGVQFIETGGSGKISKSNSGGFAVQALVAAVADIKSGAAQALVTAPISKDRVRAAGFPFPGHTEFLCAAFGAKKHAMMLFHPTLKVVLVTIHVPLKDVAKQLSKKLILEKLQLTADSLWAHFGIKRPRIAVCGLNPHAGENGLIGAEEIKIITPAIKSFAQKNRQAIVSGPHASDTVFHRALNGEFDVVLCHYHDQALIPLKTTDFYRGVNMTLGLPFVRTSPDHGTAFDIAGKGIANAASMIEAILAAKKSM
jgi:4-hydroxythreonine-4-phosphate dehydrogenase